MLNGLGHLKLPILITVCLIILATVILVSSIPEGKSNVGLGDQSVPFQNGDPLTTSITPSVTSTLFQLQPTIEKTQDTPGPSNSTCASIWGILPPSNLPEWLSTPASAEGLYTEVKYFILAGHLISSGIVDARNCIDGGLTLNGAANTCGMERAYPQVIAWQNQFDREIYKAALDNQIPAEVLKRLFAQETQFWPPNYFGPPAYGIGNVMSPGIEPLFIWNNDVYQNTCSEVFSQSCAQPYLALSLYDQQVLRGYFISHYIDAYCGSCFNGIDLDKTKSSIDYFAKLIVADCQQVNSIMDGVFSMQAISYEDAWRLTMANYAVGPSCISNGMEQMETGKAFGWEYFSERLDFNCRTDIYMSAITR